MSEQLDGQMNEPSRRHPRPALVSPESLDTAASGLDPATVTEVAHETAEVLVGAGRAAGDPELTRRLVCLVEELGLSTVADLWAQRPARSLPGALWRLYALREWAQRKPDELSRAFTAGSRYADVSRVIAGVAEPPTPQDLNHLTGAILAGVFEGDLTVALQRAAAFCRVVSAGLAAEGQHPGRSHRDERDDLAAMAEAGRAGRLQRMAEDLEACARLWRLGDLT